MAIELRDDELPEVREVMRAAGDDRPRFRQVDSRPVRKRAISDADIMEGIRLFRAENGRVPTAHELSSALGAIAERRDVEAAEPGAPLHKAIGRVLRG